MDAERARLAMSVFADVCTMPRHEQEAAILEKCGADDELALAVRRMLKVDQHTQTLIRTAAIKGALAEWVAGAGDGLDDALHHSELSDDEHVGGQFRVLRVIGEGGMGTVYEAEQVNPRRRVAIKAIRSGRVSRTLLRRFEYEAQILARLQHPGIAQVFEADVQIVDRKVQAYIAMELVRGKPLDVYASENHLSIEQRLRLFVQVCDAVQHAHQVGIIHRDLKPANILVTDEGQPKVLDFGVARSMADDDSAPTMLTQHDQIIGTLAYMSPEQVRGNADLDVRSDVYALGVVLFRLLSGSMPIDVSSCGLPEAARRICEIEPPSLRSINRSVAPDLDRVVARALEKDRARRYASARDLSRDVERFLSGEPVDARRDSQLYLIRKVFWRHRAVATTVTLVLVMLVAFSIYASRQASTNRILANDAAVERTKAEDSERKVAAEAVRLQRVLYYNRIGYAQAAMRDMDARRVHNLLKACPTELRGWEWGHLNYIADQSEVFARLAWDRIRTASARGSTIASGGYAGEVVLVDFQTGRDLLTPEQCPTSAFVALSADEKYMASGGPVGLIRVHDTASGNLLWSIDEYADGVASGSVAMRWLEFSPDGATLHAAGDDSRVRVYDTLTGTLRHTLQSDGPMILVGACLPDSRRLATGDSRGRIQLWDLDRDVLVTQLPVVRGNVHAIAASKDERLIGIADTHGELFLLDGESLEPAGALPHLSTRTAALCFSPDNTLLAAGGIDGALRLVDMVKRNVIDEYLGHGDAVLSIAFSDDGSEIYTSSSDGTARKWPARQPPAVLQFDSRIGHTLNIAFTHNGADAFVGSAGGGVRLVDLKRGDWRQTAIAVKSSVWNRLAASPDGLLVAVTGDSDQVRIWDAETETQKAAFSMNGATGLSLAFSDDGRRLACGDDKGRIHVWSVPEFELLREFPAHQDRVMSIDFDGSDRLASAALDGSICIWGVRDGSKLLTISESGRLVYCVAFNQDGTQLVSCGEAQFVQTWDAHSGQPLNRFAGHMGAVLSATFHPNGKLLVTGGADRVIRLWNVDDEQEILALRGHERIVERVAFTPDGRTLVSTSDDSSVRIWRSTPNDAWVGFGRQFRQNKP